MVRAEGVLSEYAHSALSLVNAEAITACLLCDWCAAGSGRVDAVTVRFPERSICLCLPAGVSERYRQTALKVGETRLFRIQQRR